MRYPCNGLSGLGFQDYSGSGLIPSSCEIPQGVRISANEDEERNGGGDDDGDDAAIRFLAPIITLVDCGVRLQVVVTCSISVKESHSSLRVPKKSQIIITKTKKEIAGFSSVCHPEIIFEMSKWTMPVPNLQLTLFWEDERTGGDDDGDDAAIRLRVPKK